MIATTSPLVRLFRIVAVLEACSWAGLLVGMALKYGPAQSEAGAHVVGPLHGALFMLYVLLAVGVARRLRWSAARSLLALAAAVPPFTTLVFERATFGARRS